MTLKWESRFMELAKHIGTWSKDQSRKVGCVIVGSRNEILSTGFNGFPRGVNDDIETRHQRPAKYQWTEHCERNAIFNAASTGTKLHGAVMFLPWYPCVPCARAIIQSGIAELVCIEPDWNDATWKDDFAIVPGLLSEGNVIVRFWAEARK